MTNPKTIFFVTFDIYFCIKNSISIFFCRVHTYGKYFNFDFFVQTALNDALNYLKTGKGNVAIFDATNTTRERRHLVYERIVKENNLKCMFLGMDRSRCGIFFLKDVCVFSVLLDFLISIDTGIVPYLPKMDRIRNPAYRSTNVKKYSMLTVHISFQYRYLPKDLYYVPMYSR